MHSLVLASANPMEHVTDHGWIVRDGGAWYNTFSLLSNHIIMMLIAAAILMVVLPRVLKVSETEDEIERMTPKGGRNAIETLCGFLRDFVARPNLGPYTDVFVPYVWSVFFFILTVNVLGLLPLEPVTKPFMKLLFGAQHGIFGTATGNIWTTGALAISTLAMMVYNGVRFHGFAYIRHFFMGPFPLSILIAFLELIGLVAKTFALAIRLFANMLAGHILLAVLLSFIMMAGSVSYAMGFAVAVPTVLGAGAIYMLELFVAFLQAFIFTFLSCVFIGQSINIHHDDQHGGHEESVAHT